MVAFYIPFMEVGIGKTSAIEFAYVYCIKALAKNEGFYYTSKWDPDVERVWGAAPMTTWAIIRIDIFFILLIALENSGWPLSSELSLSLSLLILAKIFVDSDFHHLFLQVSILAQN